MATLAQERAAYEQKLRDLFEAALNDTTGEDPGQGTNPGRQAIIDYVKAKLDELLPQKEGLTFQLSTAPNLTNWLDLIIDRHLEESVKGVTMTAPPGKVWPSRLNVTTGVSYTDRPYSGYIALPDNFLRLASLRMLEWKREVNSPITPEDHRYAHQQHAGIRGGAFKPVAVLMWKTLEYQNRRVLEYYSVKSSHAVDYLYYHHPMKAEDFVAKNPGLYDSLAWMCAAKVMQITHQDKHAEMANKQVELSYQKIQ